MMHDNPADDLETSNADGAPDQDQHDETTAVVIESDLIEDVSIDGMCGVY